MIGKLYSQAALASPYWNEYMETMPRERLDAIQLRRLKGLITFAYENVPLYRDLYDRAKFKPGDLKSLDDYVQKVPTIDKTDVLHSQAKHPPYGDAIVTNSQDYINLFYMTSGTTGKPMMEPGYFKDILNLWPWKWWAHGIRSSDIFYFAFNFGTYMAFWSAYYDAVYMGAQVISGGGADSKTTVHNIIELKPTVLVATPTFALRLAEVAREMGIDMAKSTVRIVTTAGEPGPVVPGIRNAIEKAWGAKAVDLYGISELWGSTSWHCPNHLDLFHLTEAVCHGIVVDEQGQVVPDGGKGELILTSYSASVQPLIKYRTHDIVEWSRAACDCGRTWVSLRGGVLGRTDQMVNVKGTNVYPTGVQALLGEIAGLTDNLEIHINRVAGGDTVSVKVEPDETVARGDYGGLKETAEADLRRKTGVRIGVEIVEPKSLPRYQLKAKKVFDHRQEG